MVFPILLCSFLLVPLFWVMVRGQDAWPFSHYPMFSQLTNLSEVEVFRLALETTTGEIVWWRSEFYRYPEYVGRMLKQLHEMEIEAGRPRAFASLERQRYLAEVQRVIETEVGRLDRYQAFQIVRRTVDTNNGFTIKDQTVARIPIAEIKKIERAD